MKFACGIVTYYPNEEDIKMILHYSSLFDGTFVYDNTDQINYNAKLFQSYGITVFSNNTNDGLSIACSVLCKNAKRLGYDYILLLDQDSIMEDSDIRLLKESTQKFVSRKIGVICPQIRILGRNTTKKIDKEYSEVSWCITSGSLIKLNMGNEIFDFDINYFIDRVDKDFCKLLRDKGYHIIRIENAKLFQKLGKQKKILGKTYQSHSPIRHYYIQRNRLYYNKKYKINCIISILQSIRHLFEIILWESCKMECIKMYIKGVKDYRDGKMGKISKI